MALNALELTLRGSIGAGFKLRGSRDPGREFLLLTHLLDETNTALSVQCKSGEDRTLTMLSLKVAARAFEEEMKRPFDPKIEKEHEDHLQMMRYFTDAANRFGQHMVKVVRGYGPDGGKVKWDGHRVPRDWYNPNQNPSHPIGTFSWG